MRFFRCFALLALGCLFVSEATAATINYVDASPANTTALSGNWIVRGNGNGGAQSQYTSGDGSNFANEGSVLQNIGATTAGNELVTTISGLDSTKTYNIYGFFWDAIAGSQSWDLDAGLTSGNYKSFGINIAGNTSIGSSPATLYSGTGVAGLNVLGQDTDDFTDFIDGNRQLWYGLLGQVSGVSSQNVYVNTGLTNPVTVSAGRTWYDGVGFEVIPEPSSIFLLGLGTVAALATRKRS